MWESQWVVLVTQLCMTLCDPMDCNTQGSSVHRILQAGILEWVAIPFSKKSSQPRDQTWVSHITNRFNYWFLLYYEVWMMIKTKCEALNYQSIFLFKDVFFFLMWTIFKDFNIASVSYFGFWPWGMLDLSSPTRNWTHIPWNRRQSLKH